MPSLEKELRRMQELIRMPKYLQFDFPLVGSSTASSQID
jgi:hypothetical protein